MKPRDVQLSRRLALDYLLIGIAMGGAAEAIAARIEPTEMLTNVGKLFMAAAISKDRQRFVDVFHARGYKVADGETICEAIIRIIKESNADQSAMAVADAIAEQMATFTDLADTITQMEKAIEALKHFQQQKEQS